MVSEKWVQRTSVEYARGWNELLPKGVAWPRDPSRVLQLVVNGLSGIWGDDVEGLAALLLKVESDPRATDIMMPEWERAFGLPDICLPSSPTNIADRQSILVDKMTFLGAQSRQFFIDQAAAVGQTVTIREYSPYQCGISGVGDTTTPNVANIVISADNYWLYGTYIVKKPDGSAVSVAAYDALGYRLQSVMTRLGGFTVLWRDYAAGNQYFLWDLDATGKALAYSTAFYPFSSSPVIPFGGVDYRWGLGPAEVRFAWTVLISGLTPDWNGSDIFCQFNRWKPAHTAVIFDYSLLQEFNFSRPWNSGYVTHL